MIFASLETQNGETLADLLMVYLTDLPEVGRSAPLVPTKSLGRGSFKFDRDRDPKLLRWLREDWNAVGPSKQAKRLRLVSTDGRSGLIYIKKQPSADVIIFEFAEALSSPEESSDEDGESVTL